MTVVREGDLLWTPERAANRAALRNPAALDFFLDYAKSQRDFAL